MKKTKRIVLAGGSGFLGRLLADDLVRRGFDVVILTRRAHTHADAIREVTWDGKSLGEWVSALDGAEAAINLAGRSVNCRYNARNRRDILESRVGSTRALGQAIAQCPQPPRVWLNAGTATIYKHSFDRPMDEAGEIGDTSEAKDEFSVCQFQLPFPGLTAELDPPGRT